MGEYNTYTATIQPNDTTDRIGVSYNGSKTTVATSHNATAMGTSSYGFALSTDEINTMNASKYAGDKTLKLTVVGTLGGLSFNEDVILTYVQTYNSFDGVLSNGWEVTILSIGGTIYLGCLNSGTSTMLSTDSATITLVAEQLRNAVTIGEITRAGAGVYTIIITAGNYICNGSLIFSCGTKRMTKTFNII